MKKVYLVSHIWNSNLIKIDRNWYDSMELDYENNFKLMAAVFTHIPNWVFNISTLALSLQNKNLAQRF